SGARGSLSGSSERAGRSNGIDRVLRNAGASARRAVRDPAHPVLRTSGVWTSRHTRAVGRNTSRAWAWHTRRTGGLAMKRAVVVAVVLAVVLTGAIAWKINEEEAALAGPASGSGVVEGEGADLSARMSARVGRVVA